MSAKCIFIGGKQIGVNCLRALLSRSIVPSFVVPNSDDLGSDTWYESLRSAASKLNLRVLTGCCLRDPEIVEEMEQIQPEVVFCIGGTQIIHPQLLKAPILGTLNIHPALLPRYRGRYSIPHAIFNGETQTGVTLHWMDEGVDSGPIISQKVINIEPDDNAKDVYDKFTDCGTKLFEAFLDLWQSGHEIDARPQDELQATYYPKGLPNNAQIDWSWPGYKIRNYFRAMTFPPFDPPGFALGKKHMVVIEDECFNGYSKVA